jgi:hypothetical protein
MRKLVKHFIPQGALGKLLEENPNSRKVQQIIKAIEADLPHQSQGFSRQIRKASKELVRAIDKARGVNAPVAGTTPAQLVKYKGDDFKRLLRILRQQEKELSERASTVESVSTGSLLTTGTGGTLLAANLQPLDERPLGRDEERGDIRLREKIGEVGMNQWYLDILYRELGQRLSVKDPNWARQSNEMREIAKDMTRADLQEVKNRISELKDYPMGTQEEIQEISEPTLRNINVQ